MRDGATLPEHAAALTFDDGYRSVLELADPMLRKLGLPYAIFVPSAFVATGERLPTYVMRAAIAFTEETKRPASRTETTIQAPHRGRPPARCVHAAELLRSLPLTEAKILLAELRALLGPERWREIDEQFESEELLGWPELGSSRSRASSSARTRATTS